MTRIYSVIVMLLVVITVCAQGVSEKKSEKLERAYYLQLTGGINYSMSENTRLFNVGDIIKPVFDVSFGKEFNPYWSAELQLGYNRNVRIFDDNTPEMRWSDFNSVELFLNGAYNLSNGIGGFNPERKGNIYAYAGIGLAYTFMTEDVPEAAHNRLVPGGRIGFTYSYAFNKRVAAIADLGWYAFADKFNDITYEAGVDSRLHAQVGFRVYLGNEGNKKWVRDPEIQYVEKTVIQRDTVRITDQVIKEVEAAYKMETIFFPINSYEIRESELSKIQQLADWLKAHPAKAVLVIGSADRNTGSEKINADLRANRARVVAEMLMDKYGVDKSRVRTLMGKGEKDDLYQKQYEKNRAAICIITDFQYE